MSGLYKQFAMDKSLEKDGVDVQYGKNDDGSEIVFRIARAGGANTQFAKVSEHKLKPHMRQIQTKTADKDVLDGVMKEIYAETVILGWRGVQDREGNELPFTRDNVLRVLNELPELWKDVQRMADEVALYREQIREANSGN